MTLAWRSLVAQRPVVRQAQGRLPVPSIPDHLHRFDGRKQSPRASRQERGSVVKTLLFAFLGGMAASAPAFALFNELGVSPYQNFDAVLAHIGVSIAGILTYYGLILFLPAFGSAIGAKLGGRGADLHYIYGRGVAGQCIGVLVFAIVLNTTTGLEATILGLSASTQTLVALATAQVGCTLGTVWGL